MLNIALYHPQIPQNAGTLMRLSSCLGVKIDLIRPFGFLFNDKKLKRAGMDYISTSNYEIHDSFELFCEKYQNRRLIALEANNEHTHHNEFIYKNDDIIIVGSEHYGFLANDFSKIPYCVKIPMLPNRRSLNMAIATTIVLSEAMSQLNLFPNN
ncbi:MAG: tRNA methyltransferase [Alphaproteobacteria bacterium]|nr:tRNA methyltransferase [Alphaproteobacteria bacterium]